MRASDQLRLAVIQWINCGRRLLFGCKWTPRAGQAAALARKEAAALKHDCVQETHLLVALGHMGGGLAAERLRSLGFEYPAALAQAQAIVGLGTVALESTTIPFSEGVKRIFVTARALSWRDGLWYFGTEHLFLALLQKPEPLLQRLVEAKGLALDKFRTQTESAFRDDLYKSLLGSKQGV